MTMTTVQFTVLAAKALWFLAPLALIGCYAILEIIYKTLRALGRLTYGRKHSTTRANQVGIEAMA